MRMQSTAPELKQHIAKLKDDEVEAIHIPFSTSSLASASTPPVSKQEKEAIEQSDADITLCFQSQHQNNIAAGGTFREFGASTSPATRGINNIRDAHSFIGHSVVGISGGLAVNMITDNLRSTTASNPLLNFVVFVLAGICAGTATWAAKRSFLVEVKEDDIVVSADWQQKQ